MKIVGEILSVVSSFIEAYEREVVKHIKNQS